MQTQVNFSYFYGEESEQFSYFRIPRLLVRSKRFKTLSTDAKLLYGLMLDRMGLSAKHGWYDELGRVYIYYTLDEIQTDLMTASHALSQLSYTPKWNYYRHEVLKSADCAKNRETFVGA